MSLSCINHKKKTCSFFFRINKIDHDLLMSLIELNGVRFICYKHDKIDKFLSSSNGIGGIRYLKSDGCYSDVAISQSIDILEGYLNLGRRESRIAPVMKMLNAVIPDIVKKSPSYIFELYHGHVNTSVLIHEMCLDLNVVRVGSLPRKRTFLPAKNSKIVKLDNAVTLDKPVESNVEPNCVIDVN